MKKILHILIIIIIPLSVFGQDEYLSRLSISGGVSELGISPSEEIWVATKAGNIYYTKQIGELWHIGPYGSLDPYDYSSGKTFERLSFFSEDTLMISGFIQEGGKQDFVFWSGNHGKNWEKVKFGKSSWIDAAYINNDGKAWMSGSSQLIYHTKDNGQTWESFDKVEQKGNLRFMTIHFSKDEKTGLFGSSWNKIYLTPDNCQSWVKISTPLDQNKYQRLSKEHKPNIRKVRIFGDYYIINQQGKVFITKRATIEWKHLPNVIDFEVSENEELYTVNQDLTISLYDSTFSKTWQSEKSLENSLRAIGIRNNNLFVLTIESIYRINPDDFMVSQLFTDEIPIQEPYLKLNFQGEEYGFANKDILSFDKKKKQWFRFMTVDFSVANATLFDNKLILADRSLNKQYSFDPKEKSVNEYNLPERLFSNLIVKELHFENGSQGCFHSNNSLRTYINKGDKFVVDKKTKSSEYLSRVENEIEAVKVERIINAIDKSRFSKVSLTELNITENDINEFKKFIDKEEKRINKSGIDRFDFDNLYSFPGEKTDFTFYKSVADSLFTLSDEEINNVFWQAYGNWEYNNGLAKSHHCFSKWQKIDSRKFR